MAKCDICGKGAHQKVAVNVNGAKKRMHVCTSCLRSGKVERAI